MPFVIPKQLIEKFAQSPDIKKAIIAELGDLDGVQVMFNYIMVAIYIRPEKTKGGIIRPVENVSEDLWQGKVGLVVKKGTQAFHDDRMNQFRGESVDIGDWVAFKVGDSWQCQIKGVPCRLVEDTNIRMKLHDPASVF